MLKRCTKPKSTYVEKSIKHSETEERSRKLSVTDVGSRQLLREDTRKSCSNEQRQALHAVLVCSLGAFIEAEDGGREGLLYVLDVTLTSAVCVRPFSVLLDSRECIARLDTLDISGSGCLQATYA